MTFAEPAPPTRSWFAAGGAELLQAVLVVVLALLARSWIGARAADVRTQIDARTVLLESFETLHREVEDRRATLVRDGNAITESDVETLLANWPHRAAFAAEFPELTPLVVGESTGPELRLLPRSGTEVAR